MLKAHDPFTPVDVLQMIGCNNVALTNKGSLYVTKVTIAFVVVFIVTFGVTPGLTVGEGLKMLDAVVEMFADNETMGDEAN